MSCTIWHNPACSTSRKVLARLTEAGERPNIILYLETGWQRDVLETLIAAAGLTPARALRLKEPLAASLGLDRSSPAAEILDAMLAHPRLVERPFVQNRRGTKLCRPAETVEALLT